MDYIFPNRAIKLSFWTKLCETHLYVERKRDGKKKKSEKKEIGWKKEAGLELMVLVTFIELDITFPVHLLCSYYVNIGLNGIIRILYKYLRWGEG